MNKKRILIAVAIVLAIAAGFIIYTQMFPGEYVPAADEIALHVQFDVKEDVGLLVFDYHADDSPFSGGLANADKSPLKHDSELIQVWNREELNSASDCVELSFQFRIITEYVEPNYENIYPEEITVTVNPISWNAKFGESYWITITGDKTNGYHVVLNNG